MFLKSKLLREEIKHWLLILSLGFWALLASLFALKNNTKTILIGIDDSGSRLISETNDRILQNELKNFIKYFVERYYIYDEKTYADQMSLASDLMAPDLWEMQKPKLLEIKEKIQKLPLVQLAEIESLDKVDNDKIEGVLNLIIKSKITEHKVRLKITLKIAKSPRTEQNPWGFEIVELSDVVL
ncbi:hypothetical protein CIK05_11130 [Bdellovibrio sp. qaytius]|nr:hypothetical protein CIK05_11130 [Bdellovibrio sp. qaytius]